ncbi:MAG: hypothetical protein IH851_02455 [Armatimonadetes bacterium]|nr:hypothetical protein [Armatimonadota bacterium]
MKVGRALPVGICLAVGAAAPAVDMLDWLNQYLIQRITVSGRQVYGLHVHRVNGDEQTFRDQYYYRARGGVFTDERDVLIIGRKVLGYLDFEFRLDNNPFRRPRDSRVKLTFDRGPVKADAGDITVSLGNRNELISITRTAQGGQVQLDFGRATAKLIYTESRTAVRTISITGNNSAGPYSLQAGFLIDGSVRVRVDGVEQRLGVDFVMNIDHGTITFLNRVIPPTSTIVVTYETYGLNQSRGGVAGVSVSYELLPAVRFGYTMVEQSPRGGGGLRQTTEEFEGFGPPSTPYPLLHPPLRKRPIIITVDGVLQVEGIDYFFDEVNPQWFFFTRFMPPSVIIRVTYTPMPDPGTFGNARRRVQGVDMSWNIGGSGVLALSAAQSRLFTPTGVESGSATAARLSYDWGKLGVQARWRNIPSTYVSVESRGFNRNEAGTDVKLDYEAGKGLRFNLSASQLSIATPTFEGGGIGSVKGSSRDLRFGAVYQPRENRNLFFNASTFSGDFAGRRNTAQNVTTGYKESWNRWSAEVSLTSQRVTSPVVEKGGELRMIDTSLVGGRVAGSYEFSDRLTVSTRVGLNSIESDGEKSVGRDLSFHAEYRPSDQLEVDLTWADTFSGNITNIGGFSGGSGYGYNGNGFSGGAFPFGLNTGATRIEVTQLRTRWTPRTNLSLDATFLKSQAKGDNVANSGLESVGLRADWSPNSSTSIFTDISRQKVRLFGNPGSSTTTLLNVGLQQKFGGRWSLNAYYTSSVFGGSGISGFGQNVTSYRARLGYRIAPKQSAFAEYSAGNVLGYLADRQTAYAFGYSYEVFTGVGLVAVYRARERVNLSPLNAANSFSSSGFDIELRLEFNR